MSTYAVSYNKEDQYNNKDLFNHSFLLERICLLSNNLIVNDRLVLHCHSLNDCIQIITRWNYSQTHPDTRWIYIYKDQNS